MFKTMAGASRYKLTKQIWHQYSLPANSLIQVLHSVENKSYLGHGEDYFF